ncbi:hypothetical protein [Encephalitozoon cuniculi GB-M1]|uniref:Uncharacterized protein n=2 Tax=Encephalitozoon cuniculi TaxID=6035 RepID=Q8SUK2_ENCCU|nr:uncharacterized protein ECU08_1720 [Encephalitozoon cuniculi GB-M1]CAD26476.2 hypothetical protein [Encephalitozoon cuniculi GB-M1]
MKSAAVICMLVGAISGFTISSRTGEKRYMTKGGSWKSPSGVVYELVIMSASGNPIEFRTEEISPGIKVIKGVGTNQALDLHHPSTGRVRLIFYTQNNELRQTFEIGGDEKNGYYLKNSEKCLQYDETGNIYGVTCSSNPEQKFDIVYSPEDSEYKPPAETQPASKDLTAQAVKNPSPLAPQVVIFNEGEGHHSNPHHQDLGEVFSLHHKSKNRIVV